MSRSEMTAEDIAWLEMRLGEAAARVSPRIDFVTQTKSAVLNGTIDDPEASTLAAAFVVTAIAAAAAGLVAAVLFLMTRRRRD